MQALDVVQVVQGGLRQADMKGRGDSKHLRFAIGNWRLLCARYASRIMRRDLAERNLENLTEGRGSSLVSWQRRSDLGSDADLTLFTSQFGLH